MGEWQITLWRNHSNRRRHTDSRAIEAIKVIGFSDERIVSSMTPSFGSYNLMDGISFTKLGSTEEV